MPKTPYFYFIKQISRVRNNHPRALSQTKNCFSAIPQAPLRTEYRSPHSKKASLFFIKILCIPRLLSLFCQNSLRLALKKTLLLFHQNSLRPALALPFCQNSLRPALKEGSLLFRQNSLRPAPSLLFFVKICPHPQTARGGPACSAEQARRQAYYGAAVS